MELTIFNLLGIIELVVLSYLMLSVAYLFVMALASRFYRPEKKLMVKPFRKMAVFIPAYKEDAVILNVAEKALAQNYPADLKEVIVVADQLRPETLQKLKRLDITLTEVSFEQSTKSKALREALNQCKDRYFDIAVVLDADNVMAPDFLFNIHDAFDRGASVVQGRRVAKNMNTPTAVMDAWSEEVNNSMFSAGQRVLGLSSRLAGSGMAFDFQLFNSVMASVNAIGGFDKELELKLIRMGYTVEYLAEAIVYDEKVSDTRVLTRQRSRWIAAQYHYARHYFPMACRELLTKGKLDFFNKAFQMVLPPRMILPLALFLLSLLFWLSGKRETALLSATFLCLNFIAYVVATPSYMLNTQLIKSMRVIPLAMLRLLPALLKLGEANKKFIHTPHTSTH
jgi:cellulose synthase/poly-beta-1,6-N-acetylglucosamine synthase-like glycosyltransferase